MSNRFSRRDFLKLLTLLPAGLASSQFVSALNREADAANPHILILVFDAWSARHMSMFGYPRQTMPNLERFAERTYVFHNHYSTGSFTVPGTASLLTGLYPWTHRALHLGAGGVARPQIPNNLFAAFSGARQTFGYSQNPFADMFLHQFHAWLDTHLPNGEFSLERHQLYDLPILENDAGLAFAAFDNSIFAKKRGLDSSLFVELFFRLGIMYKQDVLRRNYKWLYPRRMPASQETFLLDQTVDGCVEILRRLTTPTVAYFHFFPPHAPYAPTKPFVRRFQDGWAPPEKPHHPLSQMRVQREEQLKERLIYDQYLAAWDAEMVRLLDFLETSGLLDKSIVVITSDHGELFERGEIAHNTLLLSDPVVHIPLFVSLPGQKQRADIRTLTSSVDLLPTLAHLSGVEIPAWAEGQLLPGLGGKLDSQRGIYSLDAKMQSAFSPFTKFSLSLTRENHKLVYYQYPEFTSCEFFDLEEDPEELSDLYPASPRLALKMKDELMEKVKEFDRPFTGGLQ